MSNELVTIDNYCEVSKTSLTFKRDVTKEEWQSVFDACNHIEGCIQFWVGDLLKYREQKWGMYDDIAELTGRSKQALKDSKWVSEKVSCRQDDLSFEHHKQVAPLPPEKQREFLEKASSGKMSVRQLKDEIRATERRELAEASSKMVISTDLRLGDFEEVLADVPDGCVDCIITDPPYPREYIDCWSKLSRFAKEKLKPNGFCIAYSGQMNLPEVIKRMSEHLDYYWTFALYHPGSTQIVNGVNLMCRWKPILIFQNGKKKINNTIQDYVINENREKYGHEWQQGESGVAYLVEMFTNPGELIIDPFAGSGTTLRVCNRMGRNVIGAEIDEESYNIAKSTL